MNRFYLIGLTGNLGSGKSTVRRMLEQQGAGGIDADALAHVAMRRGSPTWRAIYSAFGSEMLSFNGRIDRQNLGSRVFSDADKLKKLESIVQPAVGELTKELLRASRKPVVVIEAVKLVEAGMHLWCDSLWVVKCAPEAQIERVVRERQMSREDARARIAAQGPLDGKLRLARVVIDNSGDEVATRAQVHQAWNAINPETARDKSEWLLASPRAGALPEIAVPQAPPAPPQPAPAAAVETHPTPPAAPEIEAKTRIEVRRARRGDLDKLSAAIAKSERRDKPLDRAEALKRFGERGYRIAIADEHVVALAAWEAENLVAIVRDIWAESASLASAALPKLLGLIEEEARGLLCEAILLLIGTSAPPFIGEQARACQYQACALDALHPLWRQVARDRLQSGDQVWLKRLREELITQPV